jgi:calcium-dependent protein kinase
MKDKDDLFMTEDDVEEFMNTVDSDNNGAISYQEFLGAVISQEELTNEQQLKQAFSMFDEDGDNNVTAEEL